MSKIENTKSIYYVEIKEENGEISYYEKVIGTTPLDVARLFKTNARMCGKKESTILVVPNCWKDLEETHNYYFN